MSERPDSRSGIGEDGSWTPAFEGQRPPFEPGHDLSTRHGAYAVLKLGPRADELADVVRDDVPMLRPADEVSVRLLALTLAQIERAVAALEAEQAGAKPTLESDLRGWVNRATQLADKLGMNPTSRARLGVDVAVARRAVTLTELAAEAEAERREEGAR